MQKVRFGGLKKALKGKGFIVALVLSVSAVGISTYVAYDTAIKKISSPSKSITQEDVFNNDAEAAENVKKGVPKDTIPIKVEKVTPKPNIEIVGNQEAYAEENAGIAPANNFIKPKPPVVMPVTGEITVPFSNGELVKSPTLGVWKTHDGIDIASPVGAPVVSMSQGKVSEVFTDPLWGICVVIDHGDGLLSCYFGLDTKVPVSVGQEVGAGEIIGAVGNTAEIEIAEVPHLHFALKKNGAWIDPVAYIHSNS
jgi:murein DD-endopeptidase MepM/ murein hydrolase activator NlpD